MEFSLKIPIHKSAIDISHQDNILLIGSCFTENIGHFLAQYQFTIYQNPNGIIYNPISIFNSIATIHQPNVYSEEDLIRHNNLYLSLAHHSSFSDINPINILENINSKIITSHQHFKNAKFIILTLGSAYVYVHKATQKIVANCHKMPNTTFEKRLLTIEEIKNAFQAIQSIVADKKIIFTVSPVRHWRDGAIENLRSKSILIESIHQIIAENKNCTYFPAYEIMMDELRDYRFYTEDMIHPNATAIQYIWQQFSATYFSASTLFINKRIEKINLLLNHKFKQDIPEEKEKFIQKIQTEISTFKKEFPLVSTNFEQHKNNIK